MAQRRQAGPRAQTSCPLGGSGVQGARVGWPDLQAVLQEVTACALEASCAATGGPGAPPGKPTGESPQMGKAGTWTCIQQSELSVKLEGRGNFLNLTKYIFKNLKRLTANRNLSGKVPTDGPTEEAWGRPQATGL